MAKYMNKNVPAKRGDIFYISNSKCYATDPSNTEGRPAIVVSSEKLNEHADVVEVGHRLSRKKAEAIWNRAYEDGHSFGFYEIRCRLSDLIDLAITLLGGDK